MLHTKTHTIKRCLFIVTRCYNDQKNIDKLHHEYLFLLICSFEFSLSVHASSIFLKVSNQSGPDEYWLSDMKCN